MGSLRAAAAAAAASMEEAAAAAAIPKVDADEACALLSAATHQYLDVRYPLLNEFLPAPTC
jgi:hypothetical protein